MDTDFHLPATIMLDRTALCFHLQGVGLCVPSTLRKIPSKERKDSYNSTTQRWNYQLISLQSMRTIVEGKALSQSTLLVRFWLDAVHKGTSGFGVYILIRKVSRWNIQHAPTVRTLCTAIYMHFYCLHSKTKSSLLPIKNLKSPGNVLEKMFLL